jgi:uncharacterized membrane protein
MNKIEKIIFAMGIGSGIVASIANLVSGNWTLGVTQFLLAFFMYTYYQSSNK